MEPLFGLDASCNFPATVIDPATGDAKTVVMCAKPKDSNGRTVLLDAEGRGYVNSGGSRLKYVRAPQYDRLESPPNSAPRNLSYLDGETFAVQLINGNGQAGIIRVRSLGYIAGVLHFEDAEGQRYAKVKGVVKVQGEA